MIRCNKSITSTVLGVVLGLGYLVTGETSIQAETIPSATAIPVVFTRTLDAATVRPGEVITAKTTQVVLLPGGQVLREGTTLIGHVVESAPFIFNPAPYASQKPSFLSVHFDKIDENGSTIPVSVSVRAIAGPVASQDASILHYRDETDSTGMRELIGGNQFSPVESQVFSSSGDIVGYNRSNGVFARLIGADYENGNRLLHCTGTNSEESVGVFSTTACGVYGMGAASMTKSGISGDGILVLESSRETVKLYAKSTALLQVVGSGI